MSRAAFQVNLQFPETAMTPNITIDSTKITMPRRSETRNWRLLRLLNRYRLAIALLLLLLLAFGNRYIPYGHHNPELARYACTAWLLFGFAPFVLPRNTSLNRWLYLQIAVDITAITLLIHASGGVSSGLGMLLILPLALTGVILPARIAAMFAAIAALSLLGEELYAHARNAFTANYFQAGLSGAVFFATALLASLLAQRLRESEQHIRRQSSELADLTQLNEHIIQQMQSGIIVVDAHGRIHQMNQAAMAMLQISAEAVPRTLSAITPELARQIKDWQQRQNPSNPVQIHSRQLLARLTPLGSGRDDCIIIYLEDCAALAQQAQQMKLASLGRLTASIAHEIRNPIGAVSHAGQLLAESPRLNDTDQRLGEIIRTHAGRVNTIIENILQLGRGKPANSQTIHLKSWLETAISEFREMADRKNIAIDTKIVHPHMEVSFDPDQLHQVVWNLYQNAVRACEKEAAPKIVLYGAISADNNAPFMEVCDNGSGIAPELEQQIFEPFFTTDAKGTGLGLYIVRELCSANQARIHYRRSSENGACFHIEFGALPPGSSNIPREYSGAG